LEQPGIKEPMASLVLLLIILNWFSGALGTLYPIKPVSGTVFSAGMPAQVKWMEDNKKPFLNSTGTLQIDLYAGKNVRGGDFCFKLIRRSYLVFLLQGSLPRL
jgi:hypothetical protein